ncbi:type I-E CRISPR-associated protein Cas5/CasD [Marinivivus vitaminiproducens]|nr:type I-E CRISPR-associated protein Cas5/CasD [Geminicoccaceae bacterium SCSIO 64248]
MRELVLFTLFAPLGSMGGLAVGERRTGMTRPARSAVLGLVAAALGIDRHDEESHAALDHGYGVAQRVVHTGRLVQDYHTVQTPAANRGRTWPTRRAELAEPTLETLLSLREYRAEPHVTAALWARPNAPHALPNLVSALLRPRFTLSFGRKACPLGLPPNPRTMTGETLVAAFDQFDADMPMAERTLRKELGFTTPSGMLIAADRDAESWLGRPISRIERRRDRVVSRKRWQFDLRDELIILVKEQG